MIANEFHFREEGKGQAVLILPLKATACFIRNFTILFQLLFFT